MTYLPITRRWTLWAASLVAMVTSATAQTDTQVDSVFRMTHAERTYLAEAIGACWIVDPSFRYVTVRVRFELDLRGFVINNYVELIEARGGDDAGQADAYEAARTAIIRCEGRGYDLPEEKYEVWRDIELSFDGRNGRPLE